MAGKVEAELEVEVNCGSMLSGWVCRLVVVICLVPLALLAQKPRRCKLYSTGHKSYLHA